MLEEAEEGVKKLHVGDRRLKEDMSTSLRKGTEDTLFNLKNLASSLTQLGGKEQRNILEKEVVDIENRLSALLSLLDGKSSETVDALSAEIEALRKDVEFCKSALLQLLNSTQTPAEKLKTTRDIAIQMESHLTRLQSLENDVRKQGHSLPVEHIDELMAQLGELKGGMDQVVGEVKKEEGASEKAFATWTDCQDTLGAAKRWVEENGSRIRKGFVRPASLDEAKVLNVQIKVNIRTFFCLV